MARVTLTVGVRDLTAGDLERINARFRHLGDSVNRFAGHQTQENFNHLNRALRENERGLMAIRGQIPDDEFRRLYGHLQRASNELNQFGPNSNRALGALRQGLRDFDRDAARLFPGGNRHLRVTPDVDRNRFRRMLLAPFRGITASIGGILSDGVGQGLSDGFRAGGPAAIAAFAVIVVGIAAILGAAIAGVLVLAFGSAFVALGGYLAAQSGRVKKVWKGAAQEIKDSWAGAGKALEPVLIHGIELMQKLSDSFLPHFKQAMDGAQGPLNDFLDHVAGGIKKFGKRAWDPLMEGFDALLLAFGPDFEGLLAGMGDSFGALGRTVRDHSGEISMAIRAILGLITTLIDVINFLAVTWTYMLRIANAGWGYLLIAIGWVITAVVNAAQTILNVMVKGFGWVPGVGKKLKAARDAVNALGDDAGKKFREMGQASVDWGKRMDEANKKRKLTVEIGQWTNELKRAREDLKNTLSQKAQQKLKMEIKEWTDKLAKARQDLKTTTGVKAKAQLKGEITDLENKIKRARRLLADQSHRKSKSAIQGDISQLQRKIASARAELNALNGKTATTYVRTIVQGGKGHAYGDAHGGIIGMASGGIARASGAARQTLVGEAGPELVDLPPGAHVRPTGATSRILEQAAKQSGSNELVIRGDGSETAEFLIKLLRRSISNKGGNVQAVLGRRGAI